MPERPEAFTELAEVSMVFCVCAIYDSSCSSSRTNASQGQSAITRCVIAVRVAHTPQRGSRQAIATTVNGGLY